MSSAKKPHKPGAWTEGEDRLLAYWQSQYGNRWAEVAKHIAGKTGQQCAQRWRHRVNPNISREKWTEAEDRKLAALVKKYGNSWAEIARRLPGRTDQQCMGRWRRHVDPSIRKESWDAEEDALLMELVEEYGTAWSDISKHIEGRSAHQCRLRWCQLTGAEQSGRSGARGSKSTSRGHSSSSSSAKEALARRLDYTDAANLRRQSTAGGGREPLPEEDEWEPGAAGHAFHSPTPTRRRTQGGHRAARRLSVVSEVGRTEDLSDLDEEGDEDEGEEDGAYSPPFTLRRTTARTVALATAAGGSDEAAAPGDVTDHAAAAEAEPGDSGGGGGAAEAGGEGEGMQVDAWSEEQQQQQQHQPPDSAAGATTAAAARHGMEPAGEQHPGAGCASGGGGGGEASAVGRPSGAAAAAAAQGQPSVAPRRPRGRHQLYIRPLQLPAEPPASAQQAQQPQHSTPAVAMQEEEEESPALTHGLAPSLDLLSPSRTLSHLPAPPSAAAPAAAAAAAASTGMAGAAGPTGFTPPSSVRKRALPASRMAAFGPRLPPLALPEDEGDTPGAAPSPPGGEFTPMRPRSTAAREADEEGSAGWRLTPSVLTLLQSPSTGAGCDLDALVSPQFGGLLTPDWAKRDASQQQHQLQLPSTGGRGGRSSSGRKARDAAAAAAAPRQGPAASLDFSLLGGTPPKKAKTDTEAPATVLQAAATGPWLSLAPGSALSGGIVVDPAAAATATHLLLPETVGRTALAAALQQGLGLASTAKTGPGIGLGSTLTSMKAQQAQQEPGGEAPALTSDSVRVQLRSLLEAL